MNMFEFAFREVLNDQVLKGGLFLERMRNERVRSNKKVVIQLIEV